MKHLALTLTMLAGSQAALALSPWQIAETLSTERAAALSPASTGTVRVALQLDGFTADTQALQLQLPDGDVVNATRRDSDTRTETDFSWTGSVGDDPHEQVLITRRDDQLIGLLSLHRGLFELTTSAQGTMLIALDSKLFPDCAGAVAAEPDSTLAATPPVQPDGAAIVDVLVVISPGTLAQLGGQPQALTFAQGSVDSANTAFSNSQMSARFRLAGVRFTARADSGSSSTDLSWLRNDAEVAGWRNEVGADMVGLLAEFSNACGQGYIMSSPGPGFAANAFQVTARSCAIGNLSYAHEHGHNLGFSHNPENGGGAAYPDAYGHYVSGNYRTVMSYSNPCVGGCTRRPFFSNPDVVFSGAPTGISGQRNNARAGNLTAPIAAAFRASVAPQPSIFANGFE